MPSPRRGGATRRGRDGAQRLRTAARASSQQLTNPERYRKEAKDLRRLPEAQYDMSPQRIGPVVLETAYLISIFLFLMWWMSVSPEFEDTRKGLLLEFGYYLIVLIGSSTACFAMFGDGLKRMFWTLPSEVPLTRMGIPVEYGETVEHAPDHRDDRRQRGAQVTSRVHAPVESCLDRPYIISSTRRP